MKIYLRKIAKSTGHWLIRLLLLFGLLWLLGLWFYQPISLIPSILLSGTYGYFFWKRCSGTINFEILLMGLLVCGVATFWFIPAPQPKNWQAPWSKAPQFHLLGDKLTIENLRDFCYRSENDFDIHYRTETYNLDTIIGADFAECHWDGMQSICHTMISFSFADGRHLVVSGETRLPEGVTQNAIAGLYKKYGFLYVFGTEEDIFALRTNYRHEDLMLMPMQITPATAKAILLHFVYLQQKVERQHMAYNTISNNCSSGVMSTFRSIAPDMPWYYDLAPVQNASISRLLFKHHALVTYPKESWDDFRRRTYVGYDLPEGVSGVYSYAIRRRIADIRHRPN